MKKWISVFENSTKLFAFLTLYLLFAGYANLIVYYRFYNIDISNYISTSEIIIASLNSLIELIWITGFIAIVFIGTRKFIHHTVDEFLTSIERPVRKFIKIPYLIFVGIAAVISIKYKGEAIFVLIIVIVIPIYLWLFGHFLKSIFLLKKDSENIKKLIWFLFLLSCTTLINVIGFNAIDYHQRNDYYKPEVDLTLTDGKTIVLFDSLQLIGKTSEFYLVYNKRSHHSIVYPASEVKKVENFHQSFYIPFLIIVDFNLSNEH